MTGQRSLIAVYSKSIHSKSASFWVTGLLAVTGIAAAQTDQNQQPHPWRRAADAGVEQGQQSLPERDVVSADHAGPGQAAPPPPPGYSANQAAGGQPYPTQQYPVPPRSPSNNDAYTVPAALTIRAGTFVTVRADQLISSDRNQPGDTFFASLAEPLVVDGVVVAQRGQTVRGRVTESQKAGRVEGTSRLGIELTGLTLVDGQQVGMHSQMVARSGGTSAGRDAGTVAATTALGAIVGASADYGRGAVIGAGAGAAAGIIGVLLTRGKPSVIYPEQVLTFQMEAPVTVITDRAPQAFRYAEAGDYGHGGYSREPVQRAIAPRPVLYPRYYSPYYYSPYYGPSYYPGYWGSGLSVFVGPRFSNRGYSYRGQRGGRR